MRRFDIKDNNRSTYWIKYLFMFLMVMWVARTTPLTSFKIGENPILTPIYIGILIYYFFKYCKATSKPLLLFLTIFGLWYMCICFKYGGIQNINFTFIYSIIIVHIAFNIFRYDEFAFFYEDIIVKLSLISLVVWGLANLFPSTVPNFMHQIAVFEDHPPTETNSIIVGLGSQISMGIRRNIGFTWEPGRFSCFIILAIFFNLIRQNFAIRNNKNFFILLITLLSTLSTTGYSVFGIIILFYILNTTVSSKFATILLTIIILPSIVGLAFMGEKIEKLFDIEAEISAINYSFNYGVDVVCPQRIVGLHFEFMNFIHDFWFGYNKEANSYINHTLFNGVIVTSTQGLIPSKNGILMGAFFYFWLWQSSLLLSKTFCYKGKYIFMFLFMMINISYDFWENCIFMYLYFSSFYHFFSRKYFSSAINHTYRNSHPIL